jgi:transposase-like protein
MAAVREALRGESSIADICRKYRISVTLFFRRRDNFMEAGKQSSVDRNGAGIRKILDQAVSYHTNQGFSLSPFPSLNRSRLPI